MQKNPFDMAGMGFNQDNPLFTSMNMMRQMWEGMAQNPMGLSTPSAGIPSAEDLDKRIKELRAVENWLRLNLSMLSSTIQGLEIQRSTLSTLQSFAQGGLAAMPGLAEAMTQATMQSMGQQAANQTSSESPKSNANMEQNEGTTTQTTQDTDQASESLVQAGQAWWGLMQQQFETLAQATAQSMQQAQSVAENISTNVANPSADTTFGKKASKSPSATATKKTAAKKAATPTKTVAKKATTAAKKAAKKTTSPS